MESDGMYLMDTCDSIILYILNEANPLLVDQLIGCKDISDISEWNGLPLLENDFNQRVNAIVDELRRMKNSSY